MERRFEKLWYEVLMEIKGMGCKNRRPLIILGILVLSIMLLMIYMFVFQSKSEITIHEDELENYRQRDPIIGTPSFQIKFFLYDGGMITIEEGGIIVVRNNNDDEWYDANDSFHELFYELYME
ncbi:MAG: hypothetical protein J6I97_02830 [Agathobacter sp.]|nr:hypothetical protein [Agathobacter sp.]